MVQWSEWLAINDIQQVTGHFDVRYIHTQSATNLTRDSLQLERKASWRGSCEQNQKG